MDWRITRYTAEAGHGNYNLNLAPNGRVDVFYHGNEGECELVLQDGRSQLDARRAAAAHDAAQREGEARYRARVSAIVARAEKQTAPGEPEADPCLAPFR